MNKVKKSKRMGADQRADPGWQLHGFKITAIRVEHEELCSGTCGGPESPLAHANTLKKRHQDEI